MKRRFVSLLFGSTLLLALSWSSYGQDVQVPPTTAANGSQEQTPEVMRPEQGWEPARPKPCSVRTLHGSYGWLGKGVVLNMPGLPRGPMTMLGKAEYDGAGNLVTVITGNYNGVIITQTEKATYQVNADCTGVISWRFGDSPLIVTQDGSELRSVQSNPPGVTLPPGTGWVLDAIGKRITPEPRDNSLRERRRAANFTCNPHNVAGEYFVQASGMVLDAPPIPAGPASGLSWTRLDHFGNSSIKGSISFNGVVMPTNDTATGIELNPDCTSLAQQTSNGAIQKIIFVNGGTEFFFLQLPPAGAPTTRPGVGAVLFGEGKRLHKSERIGIRW